MIVRIFVFLMITIGLNANLYAVKSDQSWQTPTISPVVDVFGSGEDAQLNISPEEILFNVCVDVFDINQGIDKLDEKIYKKLKENDASIKKSKDFKAFYEVIKEFKKAIAEREYTLSQADKVRLNYMLVLVYHLLTQLESKYDKVKDDVLRSSDYYLCEQRDYLQGYRESLEFAFKNLYKVYKEPALEEDVLQRFACYEEF